MSGRFQTRVFAGQRHDRRRVSAGVCSAARHVALAACLAVFKIVRHVGTDPDISTRLYTNRAARTVPVDCYTHLGGDAVPRGSSLVRVLRALKAQGCESRKSDGYFMAQCPAHPDNNPSLSVKHEVDRTLVHCFAGCDFDDVRRALGLQPADFYDVRPGESPDAPKASGADQATRRLDFRAIWDSVTEGADWLVYPLIERGRATTMYAPAGEGKSLVSLEIAAGLAAGRSALGQPMSPMNVVYWDYENDVALILHRLKSMAYTAEDVADRLHYYSFPDGAGLDTESGAAEVVAAADRHKAGLVVIDTYATSVDGEENSADTARGFARYVVGPLKSRGVANVRLDHTGKDITRGERGTSAKRGDVDYSWQIVKTGPNTFTFKNTKNRPGHAPPEFFVTRKDVPYLHHDVDDDLLAAMDPIGRIAAEMDKRGLPVEISRKAARDAGITGDNAHIQEAIKRRKDRAAYDE